MAATYKYGSTGNTVKKAQDFLGQLGYATGDQSGVYGSGTEAAFKQFQTDYGLSSTGVFDQTTLDKMYAVRDGLAQKVQPATPSTGNTGDAGSTQPPTIGTGAPGGGTSSPVQYDPRYGVSDDTAAKLEALYGGYNPGQAVLDAQNTFNAMGASRPGAYVSKYDGIINDLYNKIVNRDPFSYDVNGDALYQIYKDQYIMGGQQAMMDTMGQAAALTGGYGNSYASTAGNQAYQQYMTQLANKVPELAQIAYGRYRDEGEDLMNQYNMNVAMDERDYNRHMDAYNQWLGEYQMAYNQYMDQQQMDYGKYQDQLDMWQSQADRENQNYWTQQDMANQNYWAQQELEHNNYWNQQQMQQAQAEADRKYAYEMAQTMIGSGMLPSAELLGQAGISQADAQSIVSKLQEQAAAEAAAAAAKKKTGGSGGSSKKAGKTPTAEMYKEALDLYEAGGENGVFAFLDSAERRGYDAADLLDYAMANGNHPGMFSWLDK